MICSLCFCSRGALLIALTDLLKNSNQNIQFSPAHLILSLPMMGMFELHVVVLINTILIPPPQYKFTFQLHLMFTQLCYVKSMEPHTINEKPKL